jgi:tetratricopeptide (TPR) repeat protein
MKRRSLLQAALAGGTLSVASDLFSAIELTRESIDRTLATGTVSPARMCLIEEGVEENTQAYTRTPPLPMLGAAVLDFLEIDRASAERQPAAIQARLSEAAAKLATLAADALMKLGRLREARGWYRTARLAADDTANLALRARVRAQEGMLPYYYGDPRTTIRLAREAQVIAASIPCPATALAAAAEARALARLGRRDEAETAMRRAQELFDVLHHGNHDDAFSFPEKRLLLYLSGTLANLGEAKRAADVQRQALALYGEAFPIDPALIRLDQAVCLAGGGEVDDACAVAGAAIAAVPESHRTAILLTRGRDVAAAIPLQHRHRHRASVAELHEVLSIAPGGE